MQFQNGRCIYGRFFFANKKTIFYFNKDFLLLRCLSIYNVFYKDIKLEKTYRIDLLVEDKIIVEIKAVSDILPEHRMQLFNYMRLTKIEYGVLINFGELNLHCERYFYDDERNECYLVDKNLNRVNC